MFNYVLELSLLTLLVMMFYILLSTHPLYFCLSLIVFSLIIGGILGVVFSMWIAYALILIFLGGMMIIFIYVSTLAGNEKITLKTTFFWQPPIILLFLAQSGIMTTTLEKSSFPVNHLFNSSSVPLIFFLILFLLLALLITVKLAEGFKGSLMKFT